MAPPGAPPDRNDPRSPVAHAREAADVARHLGVQVDTGLAAEEVASRLSHHGPNRLPEPAPRPLWQRLQVDESALTGESVAVEKSHGVLPDDSQALGDRVNMAFKGTLVSHGRVTGLVVATGAKTELGRVASLLGETARPRRCSNGWRRSASACHWSCWRSAA